MDAIKKVGKHFGFPKVRIPKTESRQMRSLLARGLAKQIPEGKMVLTEKGKQRLKNLWGLNQREIHKLSETFYRRYPVVEGDRGYFAPRHASAILVLKKLLGGLKGKKILELGFRDVPFLLELKKRGALVAGIDSDPFARFGYELRNKLNLWPVEVMGMGKIFKEQKFDAAVAYNLFDLYDLSHTQETLKSMFKAVHAQLEEGGIFLIGGTAPEEGPPNLPRLKAEDWYKSLGFKIVKPTTKTASPHAVSIIILRSV